MNNVEKIEPTGIFTNYIYKAIPLAFDESMSYYETLLGVLNYLKNTVIPTVNNNADAVIELQNLYVELHDYVEHYFDNLDVQQEINNKLDEMAESGQLTDIIAQYLGLAGMITFNNVAEMKTAENLVNGSKCATLGYHSVNDNGNAFYKIRTITNEDVIDEMSIIALNDNTLIAELILNDNMNIKQFGLYEDDTNDDSDKLNSLLIFAKNKEITIHGNKKSCKITKTIDVPVYTNIEGLYLKFYEGTYANDYAIYVNSNSTHNSWQIAYPYTKGLIENCDFINTTNTDLNCIYNYSNGIFKNIRFQNFDTSFKSSVLYLDSYYIERLYLSSPRGTNYAIDLGYLGDNTNVNQLILAGKSNLLNIGNGHNGILLNNIIANGKINIGGGNVTLNNLHQEGNDAQLIIDNSIVKVNNAFLNHNLNANEHNIEVKNRSKLILEDVKCNYNLKSDTIDNSTDDIDINISNNSEAILINCYKRVYTNDIGANNLEMLKTNQELSLNNIQEFNKSAYAWLPNSNGTNQIQTDHTQSYNGVTNEAKWKKPTGTYYYCIQPIVDFNRMIKYSVTPFKKSVTLTNGSSGYLFTYAKGLYRVYRGTEENVYNEYVDVAHVENSLIDNGNYLSGYKWISRTPGDIDSFNGFNICNYAGNNIIATAGTQPTQGTWKRGDIVYNILTGTPNAWLCLTAGSPGTWKEL